MRRARPTTLTLRHAARYVAVSREIRDGIEGSTQLASVERGITEEANLQAALETLLAAAQNGDDAARESGLQLCGNLWMYWHIRGKNVSAREYSEAFLGMGLMGTPTVGRAEAMLNVALGSWMTGQVDRAREEWDEVHRLAEELDAGRELCMSAACRATLGLLGDDLETALRWAKLAVAESRARGFDWILGISLDFEGMLHASCGDGDAARACFVEALEIQQRLGDLECAGMSLGGLAALAAGTGKITEALDLYRQALASFEGVGDRGEEARILSEIAVTHLASGDTARCRRYFFDAIQAQTDIGSVRGVGHSLVGLAAAEQVDGRPDRAVQIAAAAEVYAREEGVVVVYSDETPGQQFVEQARAALSPDELARATETGRRMTIDEVLALTRQSAPGAPTAAA